MTKNKRKPKKAMKFTGIFVPTEVLEIRNVSMIEKLIICDVGYFKANGYRFSNTQMAAKFAVSRRTIINALNRLKSHKLGLIIDISQDKYHRRLRLSSEISALFEKGKGETIAPVEDESSANPALSSANIAPVSEKVAPLKGAKVAHIDKHKRETIRELKRRGAHAKFIKPTIQQLEQHIIEKDYSVDAAVFFNHYESNGWMVGKNKMRNWPAALANWNAREKKGIEKDGSGKRKTKRDFAQTSAIGETVKA